LNFCISKRHTSQRFFSKNKGGMLERVRAKRIPRTYRVHPLFDLIVKRGSKELGVSESDFISFCVFDRIEHAMMRYWIARDFAAVDGISPFNYDQIREARADLVLRWLNDNPELKTWLVGVLNNRNKKHT